MIGTTGDLLLAALAFVGSHFALSWPQIRAALVERLGERGFLSLYTAVALGGFVWMMFAFRAAPRALLWDLGPWSWYVPIAVMPVALVLLVCGYSTPNPTAVGGDRMIAREEAPPGIFRVTRHPVMSAIALWSASHLPPNGDSANVILFGALLVLAVGGMIAIDHKKSLAMGAAWARFARHTSAWPMLAIWEGRVAADWTGIGIGRVGIAVGLYVALLVGHSWIIGVPAIPLTPG